MDLLVWAPALAAAVLIPLGIYFLPAKTKIIIDTPTSTARAEVRPLWGLGAALITRALPKRLHGTPLPSFSDAKRVGHALITPGIIDVAYEAVKSLADLKPRIAKLELRLNLADTSRTKSCKLRCKRCWRLRQLRFVRTSSYRNRKSLARN